MRFGLCLLTALAVSSFARLDIAAAQNLDLERETPPLDADGFIGIQGTTTPGPGHWNFNMALGWQYRQLMMNTEGGQRIELVTDRATTTFGAQIGIGGRFAIGVAAPFVLWQAGNGSSIGDGYRLPNVAAGDPRISIRYRILGESASVPRERNEGPGIALQLTSTIPIGQTDAFSGEGSPRFFAQIIGDFHVLNAGIGAMLGYRHRHERRSFLGQEFGDEIELGLALQLPIPVIRDFAGIVEFRTATDTRAFFDRATTTGEIAVGARIRIGDVFLTSSIGAGLLPGVGTPVVRSTLDLTWAPRVHDLDQDGMPDDRDHCPPLAEDFDGFEDEDGCPDPDNDNDLIPDPDDRCPTESAEEGRDEDEDGCTDPETSSPPPPQPEPSPVPLPEPTDATASDFSPATEVTSP
ncbi:MAG: hypothetical protein IPK60_15540 [Sandaracinaceae bacterium]|jgi:OOP family OmpA-OmpF porin|nr:hypothetical protein [Sandaracinaceae bacterium]